jgi:uncharacterized repeat protein (TIGR01451 family)
MSPTMTNIKYLLCILPLLSFCSCKGLSLPFKPLFSGSEGTAAKATATPLAAPPAAAIRAASPSASPVVQAGHVMSTAATPHRAPAHRAPRLVQPVGYYPGVNAPAMTLPDSAYTGQPAEGTHQMIDAHRHGAGCPCCGGGGPFKFGADGSFVEPVQDPYGGWMPDGIKKPWPADEYICDGGDNNDDVRVKQNWDVVGLDPEDTVAHFDTVDGKTEVVASNKCCIYAPRFAAVRKVLNPVTYEGHERMAGVEKPTKLNLHQELGLPTTAVQPEQIVADLHIDAGVVFRDQTRGIGVDNVTVPVHARDNFMLHENLKFIQRGVYEASEKAVIAERSQAALVWQANQAVQVIIDGQMAHEARGRAKPEALLTYELEGKGRLRICKIASNCDAQVGEIVEFTLRFDNVGDQRIGNVTIIDHLTPRLEYIENTQSSTVKSEFKLQENPDTLVMRWEITDPLEVGQGGIIRFRCKVR